MSAVAVELVPGVEIIVICTGNSLQRIAIDVNGQPIDLGEVRQHPCTLSLTDLAPTTPIPAWHTAALRPSQRAHLHPQTRALHSVTLPPPALGPPLTA